MKFNVLLNDIDLVKEFCRRATDVDGDVDVTKGRYVIDGKSIMGLFSLDLSQAITVEIHANDKSGEIFADWLKQHLA